MGRPMDDIHAPTVPSGPTTHVVGSDPLAGLSLMELINRRDQLEEELKALGSVLDSHGVNMKTSLTTFDGFPRDDIDVAQIRTTRARIVYLKNDYKALMDRIEKGLHQHHASAKEAGGDAAEIPTVRSNDGAPAQSNPVASGPPFAKVNTIAPSSPAFTAGLKVGDKIKAFGEVNWRNHDNLRRVAEVVQANEGRSILVRVSREESTVQPGRELVVALVPRSGWGGRGTLGCHLLPI